MTNLMDTYMKEPYKSDKGHTHNYIDTYSFLFDEYQHEPVVVCEIGVAAGGSIHLWDKYFTHPETVLYGIDINTDHIEPEIKDALSPRVHLVQANSLYLKRNKILKNLKFDIVIDDGAHSMESWEAAMKYFIPKLTSNGIFCIEDVAPDNNTNNLSVDPVIQRLVKQHSSTKIFDCRGKRREDWGGGNWGIDSIIIAFFSENE